MGFDLTKINLSADIPGHKYTKNFMRFLHYMCASSTAPVTFLSHILKPLNSLDCFAVKLFHVSLSDRVSLCLERQLDKTALEICISRFIRNFWIVPRSFMLR